MLHLQTGEECPIRPRYWLYACVFLIARGAAHGACRDCAQPGFGGPAENRFTAYDAICRGDLCREPGFPQVFVNVSNLTLFVRVTDLVFGGGFALERSFNMDDTRPGPFGDGWSFNLGDTLTTESDGSVVLRRGSGRTDRFAPVAVGGAFAAVTATRDTLAQNGDGSYTLREPSSGAVRTFSADGRLLAIRNAGAPVVALEYDAAGRLSTARYRGREIQFSFSGSRIGAVSDSAGRVLNFSYRGDGRLVRQVNADGQTVAYEYDDGGNLTSINHTDRVTAISYGGEAGYGFVASVTTPDGAARQYDIPLVPSQIRVRDANAGATLYVSSPTGLLQSVTDANGNQVSYTYDAAGRRTRTVNGSGEAAAFAYDASGNLTGITDGAGNRWTGDYSPNGLAHLTDPNGNVSTFQYDASGNLLSVTDPAGGAVTATRSANGQIATLTDPLGNKTGYQYSSDGLLTTFVDALNGRWSYQYDGAARAISRTDPGGGLLEADYGAGARIRGITAGSASTPLDAPGLRRDTLNRIAGYTDDFGNRVEYTYDAAGQMTGMTLPGDKTVTYQYDRAKRLSRVSDWLGNFALYRYDAAGFVVSVSVSGGPVTIYQYDAAHRLRAIVGTGPDGQPLAAYRYTLDANGNRTSVSALEPAAGLDAPLGNSFGFDPANRPVTSGDGRGYRYDARGNLVSIEGARRATLSYDAFGRLQTFDSGASISNVYDSSGLRAVRTVNGTPRRFVYDLSGPQARVVMEADGSNTPVAWHIHGLGLLWTISAAGTPYFYHFDGDGNVVAVSTPATGVVNRYRYDPAGRLASSEESVENPFRARGEAGWIDDGNGLIYTPDAFLLPELRLTLPATAGPAPPSPALLPRLSGAGACFLEGVAACAFATGRRDR